MKTLLIILLFLSCSPSKDIQVQSHTWTLENKIEAYRFPDGYFVWLIWKDSNGRTYSEFIPASQDPHFVIGMQITNRDKR